MKIKLLFIIIICTISYNKVWAQSGNSNIGTEFWTGYMDHVNGITGTSGSQMNLYIACDVLTTVTISSADNAFNQSVKVVPNVITTFSVPTSAFLGNTNGITTKGIHIVSINPIAVYAHIYANSVSGATLLLPVNTLSNDYYSLNYTQISNASLAKPAYSAFMVVAISDSTTVQITPAAMLLNNAAAGVPFTVTLQKGQIYQGLSTMDLTGTHISSISTATTGCKRIAVFSGSSKILIGTPNVTSDNLFQQVYPTPSWGRNYITVPLKNRNYDVFRIVVSDTLANVSLNGKALSKLNLINKFYYQFDSQSTNIITADKPIQVVQYAVTQGNNINGVTNTQKTDVGDPEMIYINPLEQNIDHVTLYSPYEYLILNSYINVVIPTAAAPSFLLDGKAPPGGFIPVPGNTSYSYGQFNVANTTHNISANAGFNAIAYGFGQAESYGYAAGTNVKNLNEYVQFIKTATNSATVTGCTAQGIKPQVILPYQTTNIIWDFGNNTAPVTQANPIYKDTVHRNSQVLYVYDYNKLVAYPKAGIYSIKVTVVDPINTLCGSNEEVDFTYTIADPPVAKFTSRDSICLTDTIGFKDLTDASAIPIRSWHWDFGNGDTSAVQNPLYTYLKQGAFTVTLTVTGTSVCSSSISKIVYVRAPAVVGFKVVPPICESPLTVSFTDTSKVSQGKITSWFWNFGDSGTSILQNPTHTFASSASFPVTLTVISDKGCITSISKTIAVNFSPKVDFNIPDVCLHDTYAQFIANVSIADKSALTCVWDFGDRLTNIYIGNPNTATGNTATHKYGSTGNYNVRLTVTAANGCIKDTVKQVTVNGSSPKAAFTVPNSSDLCSNKDVVFVNKADVPGFGNGKVTNFVMDFGDGTPPKTFRLDSGQMFTYKYLIQYTAIKTYKVLMTAYSGLTCLDTVSHYINLLPVPKTTFNLPSKICRNANSLILASLVTQQISGPPATPNFLVDNVASAGGVFNPSVERVGTHTITCYNVVKATQCADTIIKTIIVEPVAAISAGQGQIILAGGQTKLKATSSSGNNLTYSWSPSKGLSDANILNPIAAPLVDTKYTLTITSTTDSVSCPVSDTVTVKVLLAPIIPNTFTPNGDRINDTWQIKYLDSYPGCTVNVYDRNGAVVFSSIGYGIPWDGRFNNINLPGGTYYYIIDPKNGRSKISGSITIIR